MLKKGAHVKLIQPIITGLVEQTRFDMETEQLEHLICYAQFDEHNEQHINYRWFKESELEEIQ